MVTSCRERRAADVPRDDGSRHEVVLVAVDDPASVVVREAGGAPPAAERTVECRPGSAPGSTTGLCVTAGG